MAMRHIQIECNADQVLADLALLERAASTSVEVRDRLLQLGKLRADDLCVDNEASPAARAGTARIHLQLPQGFRELVAAVARDGRVHVGERHGCPFPRWCLCESSIVEGCGRPANGPGAGRGGLKC